MENLKNCVNVKIERNKICSLVTSPSFARYDIFGNDLAGIHMHKTKLFLNKTMYTGMKILENSKILMYDFFYNHLIKYTESLLLNIQTGDILNEDMAEDIHLYDISNYPKEH